MNKRLSDLYKKIETYNDIILKLKQEPLNHEESKRINQEIAYYIKMCNLIEYEIGEIELSQNHAQ